MTLTDQEINAIISGRLKRYAKAAVVAYLLLAGGVGFALHENSQVAAKTQAIAHQSAVTRVHTVEQRCDLTKKIIDVLGTRAPDAFLPFQKSYQMCEEQLGEVKEIAAKS